MIRHKSAWLFKVISGMLRAVVDGLWLIIWAFNSWHYTQRDGTGFQTMFWDARPYNKVYNTDTEMKYPEQVKWNDTRFNANVTWYYERAPSAEVACYCDWTLPFQHDQLEYGEIIFFVNFAMCEDYVATGIQDLIEFQIDWDVGSNRQAFQIQEPINVTHDIWGGISRRTDIKKLFTGVTVSWQWDINTKIKFKLTRTDNIDVLITVLEVGFIYKMDTLGSKWTTTKF
jgi:hypothetical protein